MDKTFDVEGLPLGLVINQTKTKNDDIYGPVVFQNDDVVLRVRTKEDGEVIVSAHRKVEGKEYLPRGYMIGSNMLILEKKHG